MGSIGWVQLLIVALVILVLFGRGKISEMMGDFGKGISSFKKGMNEEDSSSASKAQIEAPQNSSSPDLSKSESKSPDTSDTNS